jgi:glyoxylase-like metal-dependent hydrolase (beta-lactamase superfamily II)
MSDGRLMVGEVEVLALSDATVNFPWTLDELFPDVPVAAWEPYRDRYPAAFGNHSVYRSNYGCYLLRSQERTILVEAGMGPAGTPPAVAAQTGGHLLQRLTSEGVAVEQVELVVLSHLHPDHVGWNLQKENGSYRLTFPRARYLIHRADWEAFHRPEVQAAFPFPYIEQSVTPLQTLGALELVSGDERLTDAISLLHSPGHTPGHISVRIASGGHQAILLGDVVLHPAQITEPGWNSMFEMDPEVARETREQLLEQVDGEGMIMVARHFPEPGFGRIVRLEGRRYWQAL